MDKSKLGDINGINNIGHVPSAKQGIIDSLTGVDSHKDIPKEYLNSYKKGYEIGVEVENLLKGDQRTY